MVNLVSHHGWSKNPSSLGGQNMDINIQDDKIDMGDIISDEDIRSEVEK